MHAYLIQAHGSWDLLEKALALYDDARNDLMWEVAAKLGMDAAESGDLSMQAAGAIGALALVGISIWTSIKGRSKLKGK